MLKKRILLMYVHEYSGHHRAALVLEKAFKALYPKTECQVIDALRYAHPVLERFVRRTYLQIIKRSPEVWERLYDNPWVLKNAENLRRAIHQSDSHKFKRLLDQFHPDAVVCTQAFPCGVMSHYKSSFGYSIPLYAVLTDFSPHSYWILNEVDRFFVATNEAKEWLCENAVLRGRISVTGIPIDLSFSHKAPSKARTIPPLVLIMGGGLGIGPIDKIVMTLDRLEEDFEMAVVAGKNKKLYRKLNERKKSLKKRTKVYSYVDSMSDLMRSASLLVSKPGGLTVAEALASGLPVIFIDPIPGQEAKNASFMLKNRSAVEARTEEEVGLFTAQLLRAPVKMESMKKNMARLARPDAALRIAAEIARGD